eukprot:5218700-Karenia_brevis.AAC.1
MADKVVKSKEAARKCAPESEEERLNAMLLKCPAMKDMQKKVAGMESGLLDMGASMANLKAEQANGFNDIKALLSGLQKTSPGAASVPAAAAAGSNSGSGKSSRAVSPTPDGKVGEDAAITLDMHNNFCETFSLRAGAH